jgi:DNA-binding transcriptional regulator GbsR (MarR family)
VTNNGDRDPGADPDGAPAADPDAARERVIEGFERSAEIYGLSRSYGRLYGVLYFAHEPKSMDDLVAESGYAKSTVSTAMKDLERLHMVHRRSMAGEGKRAFFEAERDFWRIIRDLLDREVRREVDTMTRALDEAEAAFEGADTERARKDLERVRDLQRVYAQTERFLDVVTSTPVDRLRAAFDSVSDFLRR